MDTSVRMALESDLDIIVEFNRRMAEETEHRTLDRDTLRDGVAEVLSRRDRGFYLVAEAEGEVVGQLLVTYEWSDWRSGQFWWIQSVYVRSEWRGKKVFATLYHDVLERARSEGTVCGLRLYVEHENEKAKGAYRKLGMTETPDRMFEIDFTTEKRT